MSSASEEDNVLKELVTKTLQSSGVLGKLQAQLRASVFLALEDEFKNRSVPLCNTKAQKTLSTPGGTLAASLLHDFLTCLGLDFSLSVYGPESNLLAGIWKLLPRSALLQKLGISQEDTDKSMPVLCSFLSEYQKSSVDMSHNETKASTAPVRVLGAEDNKKVTGGASSNGGAQTALKQSTSASTINKPNQNTNGASNTSNTNNSLSSSNRSTETIKVSTESNTTSKLSSIPNSSASINNNTSKPNVLAPISKSVSSTSNATSKPNTKDFPPVNNNSNTSSLKKSGTGNETTSSSGTVSSNSKPLNSTSTTTHITTTASQEKTIQNKKPTTNKPLKENESKTSMQHTPLPTNKAAFKPFSDEDSSESSSYPVNDRNLIRSLVKQVNNERASSRPNSGKDRLKDDAEEYQDDFSSCTGSSSSSSKTAEECEEEHGCSEETVATDEEVSFGDIISEPSQRSGDTQDKSESSATLTPDYDEAL